MRQNLWPVLTTTYTACALLYPSPCLAEPTTLLMPEMGASLGEILMLAVTSVSMVCALIIALLYRRESDRLLRQGRISEQRDYTLSSSLRRAESLLSLNLHILMVWETHNNKPHIHGSLNFDNLTLDNQSVWPLSKWVSPNHLHRFERLVDDLRQRGKPFETVIETRKGVDILLTGLTLGASAVVSVRRAVFGHHNQADGPFSGKHHKLMDEHKALKALLDTLPDPAWHRNLDGRFVWVNRAFREQFGDVENQDAFTVLQGGYGGDALQNATTSITNGTTYSQQITYKNHKKEITVDWREIPVFGGGAGVARDITKLVNREHELERQQALGQSIMDSVDNGVIQLDSRKRVQRFNSVFCSMFGLDHKWMASKPTFTSLLQRLRTFEKVPVESDFNQWRQQLNTMIGNRANFSQAWFLPDQRKIDLVATPCDHGVMMLAFRDTSALHMHENLIQSLQKRQNETINHLKQAILVFGGDGRLIQYNDPFATLWGLAHERLSGRPHIETLVPFVSEQCEVPGLWQDILYAVTDFHSNRNAFDGRMMLKTGTVLDYEVVPLSDGATMLVFVDQTDGVNAEALRASQADMLHVAETSRLTFIGQIMAEITQPIKAMIDGAKKERNIAAKSDYNHFVTALDHIIAEGHKTRELIKGAEEWAALSANKIAINNAPVPLFNLVQKILSDEADILSAKGIGLAFGDMDSARLATLDKNHFHDVVLRLFRLSAEVAMKGSKLFVSGRTHADNLTVTMTLRPKRTNMDEAQFAGFMACVFSALALKAMGGHLSFSKRDKRIAINIALPIASGADGVERFAVR